MASASDLCFSSVWAWPCCSVPHSCTITRRNLLTADSSSGMCRPNGSQSDQSSATVSGVFKINICLHWPAIFLPGIPPHTVGKSPIRSAARFSTCRPMPRGVRYGWPANRFSWTHAAIFSVSPIPTPRSAWRST